MIVLGGWLTVSTDIVTVAAGSGEIVNMPRGEAVTIRSHAGGAVTGNVTYPDRKLAHL
jgi:ethanolamine utilization protein EutQ (cupin superfamily)